MYIWLVAAFAEGPRDYPIWLSESSVDTVAFVSIAINVNKDLRWTK